MPLGGGSSKPFAYYEDTYQLSHCCPNYLLSVSAAQLHVSLPTQIPNTNEALAELLTAPSPLQGTHNLKKRPSPSKPSNIQKISGATYASSQLLPFSSLQKRLLSLEAEEMGVEGGRFYPESISR
jgi:hypothetical protein